MTDPLKDLLHDADSPPPRPGRSARATAKLATERYRSRRHNRAMACAAVLLGGGLICFAVMSQPDDTPAPQSITSIDAESEHAIAARRSELAVLERTVARLEVMQAPEPARPIAPADEVAVFSLRAQDEHTAQLLLYNADRQAARPRTADEAVGTYQKLISAFPNTDAARAASERLEALSTAS